MVDPILVEATRLPLVDANHIDECARGEPACAAAFIMDLFSWLSRHQGGGAQFPEVDQMGNPTGGTIEPYNPVIR